MSLCAVCGGSSPDETICPHHVVTDDAWATANRIMCDFVHRAIVPPRLPTAEREPLPADDLGEPLELVAEG